MTPRAASLALWAAWVLSWLVAALWSRRAQARAPLAQQLSDRFPTVLGAMLLFISEGAGGPKLAPLRLLPLWRAPEWVAWAALAIEAAGFGFTWWARISLGELWSSSVTRKEGHAVVRTGPYAIVRHPIYTGLITAALGLAIQAGSLGAFAGLGLMTLGFWMKARLEERFLGETLGPAYADYRRTTPMLAPIWRPRG